MESMKLRDAGLTVIIPAYNEAVSLKEILSDTIAYCKARNWKLIIVNDGSQDCTKEILSRFQSEDILKVIHHKVNRGYGGAIKSGISNVDTQYCVTIDADGQHNLSDVETLFKNMIISDADLIVGNRKGNKSLQFYREFGKSLIRRVAKLLMPLKIYDINSGLKMYNTELAKKYIRICPNSMAFSDVMTLTFIYQRNLVLEIPIQIKERIAGESTIKMRTAFETVMEILNIVTLFNPLRIFLPVFFFFLLLSVAWEIPIFLKGYGISVGAMVGFITSLIFFLLGLIAEQLGNIRKSSINN
jgi:glycosyltransferase involved in cell wall biosynthesis